MSAATLSWPDFSSDRPTDIAKVYAPWLELAVSDSEEGWVLMTGTRRPHRVASSSR